jgi:hypothetical protein
MVVERGGSLNNFFKKHPLRSIFLISGILSFSFIVSYARSAQSACGEITTSQIIAKPAILSDTLSDRDDRIINATGFSDGYAASIMITHHDEERPYPRYLMIIKSSRVGSTFVYQTFKKHYNSSIFSQWEGDAQHARDHFEKCGRLPANQTGKWVCAAHLNDRFRTEETFQELVDLIRDYNASVVIQMRANAIEKGISMSKRWGKMKKFERVTGSEATEIAIANDVFEYAKGTVAFARSIVHAAYHNFIPLPSPTQERPLWIWFEDLVRSCEDKFAELFEEIGMGHLHLPPSCKEIKFSEDKGPYNPIWVETFSKEPIFRPMINYTKFNRELDTVTYRKQFERETEMTGVIYGTFR